MPNGVHRKGPGRGWVYRWREFDAETGREVKRTSPEYPTRATALTASAGERQQLKQLRAAPGPVHAASLTLPAALRQHPSYRKQPADQQGIADRHLQQFMAWGGINLARHLSLDLVQTYIDHLKAQGLAWDTRRHRLIPIRRAARMAASVGVPDPLAALRLDAKEWSEVRIEAWTLRHILQALPLVDDPRARRAIALSALMGLRPSEVCRARYCDLRRTEGKGWLLAIGLRSASDTAARSAKTHASRRLLPIPPAAWPWICPGGPEPIASTLPLIPSQANGSRGKPLDGTTLSQWLGPILRADLGGSLTVKSLRKSFLTWVTAAGADYWQLEEWVGHQTPRVVGITGRHYLADQYAAQAVRLAPIATIINQTVGDILGDIGGQVPQWGTQDRPETTQR